VLWLVPVLWALYTSFRPYADTAARGYVSLPGRLTLDNFATAWTAAGLPHFLVTTLAIVVPAVVVVLVLASIVAFGLSRLSRTLNVGLLIVFAAGSLLPPQALVIPLFRLYLATPLPALLSDNGLLYDQAIGLIAINIAFQLGFCTFVLSNYMKTISHELTEAALVDGASVLRIWGGVIMPLCRPALAALATLLFTFIYNDFFWALILIKDGDRRPITSALNNLQGQFFTDTNLLAAGALLAAIPTILVFLALQKHFISGLSLGATKG
jgi:multiple sugar transport system permease protein